MSSERTPAQALEADIKLVRPEFLQKLDAHGRVWPRRQEAELEEGALYTPRAVDNFKALVQSRPFDVLLSLICSILSQGPQESIPFILFEQVRRSFRCRTAGRPWNTLILAAFS